MFNIFNRGKIRFHDPKSYFLHKLGEVQYMIWDLDFKRFKTLELREEMRKTYDDLANKISITLNQIKSQVINPKPEVKDYTPDCLKHDPQKGILKDIKAKCSCRLIEGHMDAGEYERLYDQMVLFGNDQQKYLAQMKEFDLQIQGCLPNAEYQEGVRGLNQEIDALIELTGMIKSYIKSI